jgi:hypothetical protein
MKNNLFDTHVKEQMANARPDVPPYIWDNIMAKKDIKKPVGFWFNNATKGFLIGLVLLTGTGTTFYFNNNKTITIKPINNADEKTVTAEVPQKNKITEENKEEPASQSNDKIDHLVFENSAARKNTKLNKTKTVFQGNSVGYKTQNKSFTGLEYNSEGNSNQYNDDNIINRQIFNASLLKSSYFNPGLEPKKLPTSQFIPCPEVEKNAAGSKRYIEVYAGPDYIFRSLSDTPNSVYLQQRKASVKYLFAYSAGIRYTKVFGSGMSFRTGLNYSQINEQFTSENGRVVQNIYIINSNGDTTGTYLQSGTLYKTSTNKYKSIDIPISVGYELGNGRMHSNLNMGVMINIHSSQKGFVLDKNNVAVDITSGKSSSVYQYKTRAGISFIGAASVYYKLNESLHLMAEPYIRLSLSPATKAEISFKEKFHTAGIRLGIRMDF